MNLNNYRTSKLGCIMLRDGKRLMPGQTPPAGSLTKADVEEHLRSGYLVRKASAPPEHPSLPQAGVQNPPPVPYEKDETKPKKPISLQSGEQAHVNDASNAVEIASKWDLDPDGLRAKQLDELNAMVAERDPDVAPFEDVAEAVAFLSQDYSPPDAVLIGR